MSLSIPRTVVYAKAMRRYTHQVVSGAALLSLGTTAVIAKLFLGDGRAGQLLEQAKLSWISLLIGAQCMAYLGYTVAYQHIFELRFTTALQRTTYGFSPFAFLGGFAHDARTHNKTGRYKVAALSLREYLVLAPAVWGAAIAALAGRAPVQKLVSVPWLIGVPVGSFIAGLVLSQRRRLNYLAYFTAAVRTEFMQRGKRGVWSS